MNPTDEIDLRRRYAEALKALYELDGIPAEQRPVEWGYEHERLMTELLEMQTEIIRLERWK